MSENSDDEERDSGVEGAPVDAHSEDGYGGSAAPVTAVQLLAERRERLRKERLHIGALCSSLLESPEKRLKNLWAVVRLMDERTRDGSAQLASVRQLAALSALEVFRDLLPEYTIRHQDYNGIKLKKETLALYKYEKELLEVYQRYLQRLERGANALRGRGRGDDRLALVCVRCLCELLAARPYFNFAANIVATVVPLLQARSDAARRLAAEWCTYVLSDDVRGDISVTVVRRVARLARAHGDRLRPEALRCLLALRARDILDDEDELRRRRLRDEKHKKRIVNLSKNEKKRAKKLREVERELQETTARENESARRRHLTEATRSLFHIYFRILKGAPAPALLAAALEGVAAFAHVINVDYYSDLLSSLTALGVRATGAEALRVAHAGLAVLAGRGEVLAADPTPFLDLLFRALASLHHS
ncbi:Nucleolar complex protein 3 homolog [Eumeta japonica]|uniref:Nucleolar complex protein 3 homolog n=1 Tax=Eumeta variegata TaxID=151549 RepID=A0A4C1TC34_EUMVA|nr:Nucleolar complex protein 3 homolog [Eumeta japonica]